MTTRSSLSLLLLPGCALTQVVLSEIMFDLPGSDSPNEFVEIFNLSSGDTVDIAGWRIEDNFSRDDLTDAGMGMKLGPRSFALILEGDYPAEAGSGIYASLIPDTVLLVRVDDSAIGNQLSTTDTVTLLDGEGNRVDAHGWANISAPGFSLERIRLDSPSSPQNWTLSAHLLGTPGTVNTASPLPVDGAIDSASIIHSPVYPGANESVALSVTVVNRGTETVEGNLRVTEDKDLLQEHPFEELDGGDSLSLTVVLAPLDAGNHLLVVTVDVEGDANPDNNTARHPVTVRFSSGTLAVNEIHVAPNPGVPEFIELVNLTGGDVDLEGWSFSDSDTATVRVFPSETVPPGGYAVIAADSSLEALVSFPSPLVVPRNGFSSLNNTADTLHLFDPAGALMDRIPYASEWDLVPGRSLEKIHPGLNPEVGGNWGPSIDPQGMTPGRANSIFLETLPPSGTIALDPNPFSPDGDRMEDELRIAYTLPFAQATMTALIFDSRGRPVRTVARNLAVGAQGVLTWDGRTDNRKRARIGIYILKVTVLDRETDRSLEWVKTAILAEPLR